MRRHERLIEDRARRKDTPESLGSDLIELERRKGGPSAAARSLGVNRITWYRWKKGELEPTQSHKNLIRLVLQTSIVPFAAVPNT